MHLPVTSPQTQSLECIRIDGPREPYRWTAVPGTTIGKLLGEEALEFLDLVAALSSGEIMRCFVPGYGIRARNADELVLFEIAFCFKCNNALILEHVPRKQRDFVGFKADSRRAQDLLARFRAL
jgi:hypothetical protein